MPRAEPALSLAPLSLSAVIGAAIRTAMTTTTLRLPLGKPGGLPGVTARSLPRRFAHARPEGEDWQGRQVTVAPTITGPYRGRKWLAHLDRVALQER